MVCALSCIVSHIQLSFFNNFFKIYNKSNFCYNIKYTDEGEKYLPVICSPRDNHSSIVRVTIQGALPVTVSCFT